MNIAKPLTEDETLKLMAEVQAMEREVETYLRATKDNALKPEPKQ